MNSFFRTHAKHFLLAVCLILPALSATAEARCIDEPDPFAAEYDLLRNGKLLGTSVMTLERRFDGTWLYTIRSEGEQGLAGLLGVGYEEASQWIYEYGRIKPLYYHRKAEIAFSDETYDARFDWPEGSAQGTADGHDWVLRGLPQGTMDRLLVNLALVRDLSCHVETLRYPVAEEGVLEWWRFERVGRQSIHTPMGYMDTVKVAKQHDANDRQTLTWFVPEKNWVAARIEHVEDAGEERYTMVLRSYEVGNAAARTAGSGMTSW